MRTSHSPSRTALVLAVALCAACAHPQSGPLPPRKAATPHPRDARARPSGGRGPAPDRVRAVRAPRREAGGGRGNGRLEGDGPLPPAARRRADQVGARPAGVARRVERGAAEGDRRVRRAAMVPRARRLDRTADGDPMRAVERVSGRAEAGPDGQGHALRSRPRRRVAEGREAARGPLRSRALREGPHVRGQHRRLQSPDLPDRAPRRARRKHPGERRRRARLVRRQRHRVRQPRLELLRHELGRAARPRPPEGVGRPAAARDEGRRRRAARRARVPRGS
jgi:hypothetical protein